jgi:hypothetical protein
MREIEMRQRLGGLLKRRMQGMLAPALGLGMAVGGCGGLYGAQFPRGTDASGAAPDAPICTNPGLDGAATAEAPGEEADGGTSALDGRGIARLSASVSDVDFGTLRLNTGISAFLYLTNYGDVGTGPISIVATCGLDVMGCDSPLSVGETCILSIAFMATAVGPFSGMVTVSANPGAVTRVELPVRATVIATGG